MRALLNAATRELHQAVERTMDPVGRVQSRDDYRDFLLVHHGIMPALEAHVLAAVASERFAHGYEPAARTHRLLEDLHALGVRDSALTREAALPDLPPLRSRDAALGALYVLEGSALGGRVLFRHFEKTLGITREAGGAYFFGDGPETGRRWQRFVAVLESEPASSAGHAAAVEAACQTFRAMAIWLDACWKEA